MGRNKTKVALLLKCQQMTKEELVHLAEIVASSALSNGKVRTSGSFDQILLSLKSEPYALLLDAYDHHLELYDSDEEEEDCDE